MKKRHSPEMTLQELITMQGTEIAKNASPMPQENGPTAEELQSQIPRPTPAFAEVLAAADRAFHASDVGLALQNAASMTMAELDALAPKVLEIPEMRAAYEMASLHTSYELSFDPDGKIIKTLINDYAPQTFLRAFTGSVEFLAGITGVVGFAYDLANNDLSTVYVSVCFDLGAEGGASIGGGIGLTASAYDQLNGVCLGATATVNDVFGLQGDVSAGWQRGLWNLNLQSWACSVYLVAGIEDGGSVYGGFSYILKNDDMPVVEQPNGRNIIDIKSVSCGHKQSSGSDHIYFEVTTDANDYSPSYKYPLWDHFSIDETKHDDDLPAWMVGYIVKFNTECKITLYCNGDKLNTWTVGADSSYYSDDNTEKVQIAANGNDVQAYYDHKSAGNETEYWVTLHTYVNAG